MANKFKVEICDIDCDLPDVPILYVNGKKGEWKRVKCKNCSKNFEELTDEALIDETLDEMHNVLIELG